MWVQSGSPHKGTNGIDSAAKKALLKVIQGDATLLMRADQVEAACSVVTPILETWEAEPPTDFPNYTSGSWGPESATILVARDGRMESAGGQT